jgi:hypothetical protein
MLQYATCPFGAESAVIISINSAHCINEDILIFSAYPQAGLQVLLGLDKEMFIEIHPLIGGWRAGVQSPKGEV